jgi:hypothetical protein
VVGKGVEDPKKFRQYRSKAQDFFVAFGHDGLGQVGTGDDDQRRRPGGDSYDRGKGAGEAHGGVKTERAQLTVLESKVEELKAKHAYFETVLARLEALELRQNPTIQIAAARPWAWIICNEPQ